MKVKIGTGGSHSYLAEKKSKIVSRGPPLDCCLPSARPGQPHDDVQCNGATAISDSVKSSLKHNILIASYLYDLHGVCMRSCPSLATDTARAVAHRFGVRARSSDDRGTVSRAACVCVPNTPFSLSARFQYSLFMGRGNVRELIGNSVRQ